jgi:MEMO1 family protein
MSDDVRHPAVAGKFYPGDADTLSRDVKSYLPSNHPKSSAFGCIVPHAGYMYSGHVAGAVYCALNIPKNILILGPNHTGMGHPLAIMSQGSWETPLGQAQIHSSLAQELLKRFPLLGEDTEAHRAEHAIEVQLPFLQTVQPHFTFVPITIGTSQLDVLTALGLVIADVLSKQPEPVLIISSSDMNHYENDTITRVKDHKAIDRVLALDANGLAETVRAEHISMCGAWPTVVMLAAVKKLGAKSARLMKYATSGDISGDYQRVVGYAGIAIQ